MHKQNVKGFFGNKKVRYGGYATLITLLGIALVVLFNIGLSTLEENFDLKIDTSQSQKYTLTDQTKKILNKLDQDIYIYTVFPTGNEDENTVELLKKYKGVSGHIVVENKDPDLNPGFLQQYTSTGESIGSGSVIVSNKDGKTFRVLDSYDLYQTSTDSTTGSTTVTQFKAESSLTSAINYIVTGYMPTAWLVQGHGEPSLSEISTITTAMGNENYNVETVNIAQTPDKIKAGDIIMIINPTTDFSEEERAVLKPLMEKGGRFIFLLDPTTMGAKTLTNLEALLKLYNIELKRGIVVEGAARYMISNMPVYLSPSIESHTITNALRTTNIPIIIPLGGALKLPDEAPESTTTITPLLQTSDSSYLKAVDSDTSEKAEGDEVGPFVVAAAVENTNSSNTDENARIFIAYNTTFVTDTKIGNYSSNQDFFLNAAGWMRSSEDSIYIRAKSLSNPVLVFRSQAQLLSVLVISVLLVPVLMLVAGIMIYLRRKHL